MKLKVRVLFSAVALAVASASAYDDVQVTYRGRMFKGGREPGEPQTVAMSFRLYAKRGDASPVWTMEIGEVGLDGQGRFQVALRGDGLAEVIDAGRANWIGVSVNGGKEQYPRQALLASPTASKSAVAERFADSPSIVTAEVDQVEAKALNVQSLSLSGGITLPTTTTPVSMNARLSLLWNTTSVRGNARFFGRGAPIDKGTQTVESDGAFSFGAAEGNCVAFFSSVNSDIMPGMSVFFKRGGLISLASLAPNKSRAKLPAGTVVRCLVYPIGAE
ncbi:MAG: hypothetical protein K6G91_08845 [Kiritimatiellae bacterium]|nr:hypothetical protein [Kiritimatiellia bacterium]